VLFCYSSNTSSHTYIRIATIQHFMMKLQKFILPLWASTMSLSLGALVSQSILASSLTIVGGFYWFATISTISLSCFSMSYYLFEQVQEKCNVFPTAEKYIWMSIAYLYTIFWLCAASTMANSARLCDNLRWWFRQPTSCPPMIASATLGFVLFAIFALSAVNYTFIAIDKPVLPLTPSPATPPNSISEFEDAQGTEGSDPTEATADNV
jgi:hypothetical protein